MSLTLDGPVSTRPGQDQFKLRIFPAADSQSGIGWKLQILVFLIAAAMVFSRRPDAFLNPQFFAEDGAVWYAQAYSFGWAVSLLHTHNGYFQTLPRLAAGLALLVPLRFAPLLMNLIGLTVQILPVNLLLSWRCRDWAPLALRSWMAMAYIALPNSHEVDVAITNAQWHFGLIACMIMLAAIPKTVSGRVFDGMLLLLSGLTGPFAPMLIPIGIVFWWVRRQGWTLALTGILVLTSVIQISELLRTAAATRPKVGLGATPELLIRLVAGQVYLGAVLGERNDPAHKELWLLCAAAVLGTTVIVYTLTRAGLELKLFVTFCLLALIAGLMGPKVSMTTPQWPVLLRAGGLRYWFLPMTGFVFALIWCALESGSTWVRAISVAGLIAMLFGIPADWRYSAYPNLQFPAKAAAFEAAAPGTAVTIPIFPNGWVVRLVKKGPLCHSLPVGAIDQPAPNGSVRASAAELRGWVAGSKPIRQVSIFVDGVYAGAANPNFLRPDGLSRVSGVSRPHEGWAVVLDRSKMGPGNRKIRAHAIQEDGSEADVAEVSTTVTQ